MTLVLPCIYHSSCLRTDILRSCGLVLFPSVIVGCKTREMTKAALYMTLLLARSDDKLFIEEIMTISLALRNAIFLQLFLLQGVAFHFLLMFALPNCVTFN